jgi:dUTP pyrophosphatase
MKVKIKKLHPDAVIPSYAKPGDAGMDLTAISKSQEYDIMTFGTGLAIEIPDGHV